MLLFLLLLSLPFVASRLARVRTHEQAVVIAKRSGGATFLINNVSSTVTGEVERWQSGSGLSFGRKYRSVAL